MPQEIEPTELFCLRMEIDDKCASIKLIVKADTEATDWFFHGVGKAAQLAIGAFLREAGDFDEIEKMDFEGMLDKHFPTAESEFLATKLSDSPVR